MIRPALLLSTLCTVFHSIYSWPDGAPCVHAAFESMNPLEAVEHQGGLQLTAPPYEIAVDQKCYWRNQPIGLTLQGLNESVWFKGFVIQPYSWSNDQLGKRIGQLVRLDDNGSWQQQCFRYKDSATHSHDEKKKHMKMWWKHDEESETVQFVATVVRHQTQFWVKSVRSRPLPPCRLNRDGFPAYQAPLPTIPPPVKQFKMETFKVFDSIGAQILEQQQQQQRQSQQNTQPQPISTSPQMSRIIPVEDRSSSASASSPTQRTFQQIPPRPRQRIISQQPQPVFRRRGQFSTTRQPQQQFGGGAIGAGGGQCSDRDPQGRCQQWSAFCRSPSHQRYLSAFCARTCRFC
ncbi:unnamed protein product [Caenorhabditis angaria]|uniref:ShKT domain-containing protein n=1 Tax=Caenorhabditis angaria TaxID=860376 RepID=A0A9P1N3V0_9PELO|nr:unnamed protein product [Caenorhabditis angaria]